MDFARRLRVAIATENVRANELAAKVGISQATLSRIVNGKSDPLYSTVLRLEDALPLLRKMRDEEIRHAA